MSTGTLKLPTFGRWPLPEAYCKSLKDTSIQVWTIAKILMTRMSGAPSFLNRASVVLLVCFKGSERLKPNPPQGRARASINPSCGKRETIVTTLVYKPSQLHTDREADSDEGGNQRCESGAQQWQRHTDDREDTQLHSDVNKYLT